MYKPYIPVINRCIYYITITERNHEHLKYEFGIVWMFDNNKIKQFVLSKCYKYLIKDRSSV